MKRLDSVSTQISLLLRLKSSGDELAWSEFVERYREPIVGFCENVFPVDRDTAEDIAQDVLVKLLQQMRVFEYDAAKRFRNWMKTVAGNAVRDALRKRYRCIDRGAGTSDALAALEEVPDPDRTARLGKCWPTHSIAVCWPKLSRWCNSGSMRRRGESTGRRARGCLPSALRMNWRCNWRRFIRPERGSRKCSARRPRGSCRSVSRLNWPRRRTSIHLRASSPPPLEGRALASRRADATIAA